MATKNFSTVPTSRSEQISLWGNETIPHIRDYGGDDHLGVPVQWFSGLETSCATRLQVVMDSYLTPSMSMAGSTWHSAIQSASLTPLSISFGIFAVAILGLFLGLTTSRRISSFTRHATKNNCASAQVLPKLFLGSLRHKLSLLLYPGGDLLDKVFLEKYRKYGDTHALYNSQGLPIVIHTIDPVNLNAILTKSHDDWEPAKGRARTMYPLAQKGLLNSQGEYWHQNRKLILRHIHNKRARDVRNSEVDIQLLFQAIGPAREDGWTDVVDLLDLFHRLSLDMSTSFLLGTSADSQASGIRDARMRAAMLEFGLVPGKRSSELSYEQAYETVRDYMSRRSKLGSKYWLADGYKYRKACDTLNSFADRLIGRAIERASSPSGNSEETEGRFGLIDGLVKEVGDPVLIRELVMDLFIAGQNMSGTMAAWVFAQLEAHPDIYSRVRQEIVNKFGTEQEPLAPLTWDNLRSCTTMQQVIMETLRMYPLLANIGRNAKRDTVLPRGGGADGMQPIAVPKGAAVTCNVYLIHRREQEWGSDAWAFNPDRWTGRKINGFDYAPFGAGPRVCVGQHLTMTEISFLMARMMQRFAEIRAPQGQDNVAKGYRVVVAPKNGVKVRLRRAS